ncbi:MAG: DUF4296 domain-containing protein [Prevotellaceae bacterium]|jgi:hypothetical protein|nr:DUF4296 domain-containing protein [Prevotellaceae bacterium]
MRFLHLTFLGLIFSLATVACGDEKNIPERKLVRILAEMHLADAVLESTRASGHTLWATDSTAIYMAVLDRYGYTVEQLYGTLARYGSSKDRVTKLYDKVNERLEKLQRSARSKVEALHRQQNRWTEKSEWTFPSDGDTSRLPFSVPVEGLGEYILEANITLHSADSVNRPRMTMYLYDAAGDSALLQVEREVQRDEAGKDYSLAIANRDKAATHVRGYILSCDSDSLGGTTRHAAVRNIMLRFLPYGGDGEHLPSAKEYADVSASPPARVSAIGARRPLPTDEGLW